MSDLLYSSVTRIVNKDENLAVDIKNECGQNRLQTATILRADQTIIHTNLNIPANTQIHLKVGNSNLSNRKMILIQNQGNTNVYIGNSSVSNINGFLLYKGSTVTFSISEDINLYAFSQQATTLFIMEVS